MSFLKTIKKQVVKIIRQGHIVKDSKVRGFTLAELLITITVITVLTTIGFVSLTYSQKSTRDSRRKADLNSIAKAYELKYNKTGLYSPLEPSDITGGIPQPPEGGSYTGLITSDNNAFRICTALEDNPTRSCDLPSPTCYCISAVQGDPVVAMGPTSTPTPTPVGGEPTPTSSISTPTPTPQTSTPTPTSTPPAGGPSPTPTPLLANCTLTSASWQPNTTSEGSTVNLIVNSSGDCTNYQVNFQVTRNGIPYIDEISADIQPQSVIFTPGSNQVVGTWVAEHNPLIPGTHPDYYFQAVLMYSNAVESNPRLLTVTQDSCNLQELSNGLAAYFKLDENSGTQTYDSSGNNISGDLIDNPTWTAGKLGPGLNFNGSASPVYARINYNPTLDSVTSGSFTFSAWIKPDSNPLTPPAGSYFAAIVGKMGYPIFLGYDDQQRMVMNIYTTPWLNNYTVYSQNSFAPGSWYYVVGVVDTNSSLIQVYVNGVLEGSANYSGDVFSNGGYYYTIGASNSSSDPCNTGWSYCFAGLVDDVRIYNRALPASEITHAYNSGTGCTLP